MPRLFTPPTAIALAALGLAAFGSPAHAEPSAPGKVAGVYIQVARHLLMDISLARRSAAYRNANGNTALRTVAEVQFPVPLPNGRTTTFAIYAESAAGTVEPGDVVSVALTESKGGRHATAPVRQSDQIRGIEAKHHTETARRFGTEALTVSDALPAWPVATHAPLALAHFISREW